MAGFFSQRIEDARARRNEAATRIEQPQPRLETLPEQPQRITPAVPQQRSEPPVTYADNPPPLPYTMPAVSPVGDLKNRTAVSRQYTPEAARDLYETPTRLTIGFLPSEGIAGGYASGNIVSSLMPNQFEDAQNTLAHEHAHKWHEQRLTPAQKDEWANVAESASNEYARANNNWHPWGNENELYAYNAQRGPYYVSPSLREEYYPGLYREGVPWEGIPNEEPYEEPFSVKHWVNEHEAPLGYYEDGSAVRARVPYPSQWSRPQWPSLEGYYDYLPEWNKLEWGSSRG